MLSVSEIAERLKMSKIKVYRFINNNDIKHSAKDGRTFLYDIDAFTKISEGLKAKKVISSEIKNDNNEEETCHSKDNGMIFDIMKTEIEIKNKQIDKLTELNKALNVTLQQQQQLLLYEQQKNTKLLEENVERKSWWKWWN